MIIGVCGNGYCGSSAVTDYLRENEELAVSPYDIEFTFLYDVDAIDDLKHHIVTRPVRFYSSDAAIKRFKKYISYTNTKKGNLYKQCGDKLDKYTVDFLDKITQLSWHGWWHYDIREASLWERNWNFRVLVRLSSLLKRKLNKNIDVFSKGDMSLSIRPENFDAITREYVEHLVSLFNPENKPTVVLDQPFPVGTKEVYKAYFSDTLKTITVIRDPRDLYIATKRVNSTFCSWIPGGSVEDFIKYFKLVCAYNKRSTEDELVVHFEDLIYSYDVTTKLIDDFLGISSPKSKRWFNPERSIDNTQLFKKHTEFKDDIAIIERELAEYLYDFSQYNIEPQWVHSF